VSNYQEAGVDIFEGERAVELMKQDVARAQRIESIGSIGGFAGYFDAIALKNYDHPVLVSATDGVGTKTEIARLMNRYETIGEDLVAMVVDDLVVCGAEPLFMTDYIATGKVIPERIAEIVSGIARGCIAANTALIGGETAEHPGLLEEDEFDLAGAATAVVEKSEILGAERVKRGDLIIALASSGLHANGYSLARHIVNANNLDLDQKIAGYHQSLGEYLLTPTFIYASHCLSLIKNLNGAVNALSHITGGGIGKNIERVIPKNLKAVIDRASWQLPPMIKALAEIGQVNQSDLELTFNCGIGMAAIIDPRAEQSAISHLTSLGIHAWVAGVIVDADQRGSVELINSYQ
jgi:phosphoribosylformylglycinamidine cyclo-ligase